MVGFTDKMYLFPKISVQDQNLKKLRHGFVDETAMIATTLIPSSH